MTDTQRETLAAWLDAKATGNTTAAREAAQACYAAGIDAEVMSEAMEATHE